MVVCDALVGGNQSMLGAIDLIVIYMMFEFGVPVTLILGKKQMGHGGAKYSHYAVRVGRETGIYSTWDEAAVHVLGFPRAQFKCSKSLEKALEYMNEPPSQKMKGPYSENLERLTPGMQKLIMGLSQAGVTHGGLVGSSSKHAGGSSDGEFVPETQHNGFLIVEVMELYLLRACMTLHLGYPNFEPREFYSKFGSKMYGYKASLRLEEMRIDMEVDGCVSLDKNSAREDAAYNLLQQLLTVTGKAIMDFNYRRACVAECNLQEVE
ncbi:hypothetical protein PIB30_033967 [Stylosanthes scabra]|uniref:Ribonuclease H1 N-terminal domain-containing protein n=1 Tax=Stylosanthes scabra TaxID=79078 RepID=A0ABU6RCU1_9FABA|nr:hypothetical protein [Stylosanthes scabra]